MKNVHEKTLIQKNLREWLQNTNTCSADCLQQYENEFLGTPAQTLNSTHTWLVHISLVQERLQCINHARLQFCVRSLFQGNESVNTYSP